VSCARTSISDRVSSQLSARSPRLCRPRGEAPEEKEEGATTRGSFVQRQDAPEEEEEEPAGCPHLDALAAPALYWP